jgi:ribosome production factor 1
MFKSIEKTALQEIGPRFTLKLKWLRKGLPAVTGGASTAVPVAPGAEEESEEEEVAEGGDGDDAEETFIEKEVQEGEEDDEDAEEEHPAPQKGGKRKIPPLNQQGEFEWQWKVRRFMFLALPFVRV